VIFGGVLMVLILVGFVNGPANLPAVLGGGITAGFFLYYGLKFWLQPFYWPVGSPAGIKGHYRDVLPILRPLRQDPLYLGTYQLPQGLSQLLTRFFLPQYTYLTPPVSPLFTWVGRWAAMLLVAIPVLVVAAGSSASVAAPLTVAAGLVGAVAVQVVALQACKPWVPRPPQVEERRQTLTKAGNPQALVDAMHFRDLEAVRGGDINNRMHVRSDDTGGTKASIQFAAEIALETKPILLPQSSSLPRAAMVLEYTGVAFGWLGWAIVLLSPVTAAFLPLKLAGAVPIGIGWTFLRMAYCLRNTFRFRSDLFSIVLQGTMQRQRAGGEGAGYGTIERWKSEIHVTVLATRVLTECRVPGLWARAHPKEPANVIALKDARQALNSPRYILETQPDDEFQENLAYVMRKLMDYRDTAGDVMGANEESEGARVMIEAKQERQRQKMVLKHQLRLQEQIHGKMLDNLSPDQLTQMGLGGTPSKSALPDSLPKPGTMSPTAEKLIRTALRAYFAPGSTPEAKDANRNMIEEIARQYGIPEEQLRLLAQQVKAEMQS
jgi:hypothetical protein